MNDRKTVVLSKVAGGRPVTPYYPRRRRSASGLWFQIGGSIVHLRDVSNSKNDGTYGFGIYSSTLKSAEYEIWICGSSDDYYVIPIAVLKDLYPYAHRDRRNQDHRVVSVDIATHVCDARKRKTSLQAYYRAPLPDARIDDLDLNALD